MGPPPGARPVGTHPGFPSPATGPFSAPATPMGYGAGGSFGSGFGAPTHGPSVPRGVASAPVGFGVGAVASAPAFGAGGANSFGAPAFAPAPAAANPFAPALAVAPASFGGGFGAPTFGAGAFGGPQQAGGTSGHGHGGPPIPAGSPPAGSGSPLCGPEARWESEDPREKRSKNPTLCRQPSSPWSFCLLVDA